MQFPREYFDDEVREGFYVNGLMKRAWAAQLEVLEEIDKVCKKYGIQWYADCGTLLGAVRHGGYIPWDDDLDICMLRDDYEKFNRIVRAELPDGYVVLDYKSDENYWELLTRVTNGDRIRLDEEHLEKYHGFPFVAGIDIFPLDFVAPNPEDEETRRQLVGIVQSVAAREDIDNCPSEETRRLVRRVEDTLNVHLEWTRPLKVQLYNLLVGLFSLYTREEATEVVLMPYWIEGRSHKYSLEWFEHTVQLPFETTTVPVPIAYDAVLQVEYGEYFRGWSVGGVHEYPFYKKQERQLAKTLNREQFLCYEFKEEDLKCGSQKLRHDIKTSVRDLLGLLTKRQDLLHENIESGSRELALDILAHLQTEAINMGTELERVKGIEFPTIALLETYCEQIYQLHQGILNGNIDSVKEGYEQICRQIDFIQKSLEKNLFERKEIVFLPWKVSMWEAMESVWRAAKEDANCDIYVIPVPYYDKRVDGVLTELHYEGELFPDEVAICDYNEYIFEEHHPDMIIIQNPYDEYNSCSSVHPFFFSSNLKNYTENLVYIPFFEVNENYLLTPKAMQSMQAFVTVPGVIHADRVIVQSEKVRDAYIDELTKCCGESTRNVWEKKIAGLGSPKADICSKLEKDIIRVPVLWQEKMKKINGDYKRVVLYGTSVSLLMQYGEKMLIKMQKVFDVMKSHKEDVLLIWRPEPTIDILNKMSSDLKKQYLEIVEQYKTEAWGIYDDTVDLNSSLAIADVYYGDACEAMSRCKKQGIPIMFQRLKRGARWLL